MKNKIIKPKLTVSDLFHRFANRVAKTEKCRNYSYNENKLYYATHCIAKILSVRKKILVIDNNFNRVGSFGNGYGYWHIINAFEKDWTILYGKSYRIENLKYNKKTIYELYFNTIKSDIFKIVDKYVNDKELINNSLAYKPVYYNEPNLSHIFELAEKFKLDIRKIKNYVYNENHWSVVRYLGWGKSHSNFIKIDKPISFWLDSTKWHTPEECKILEFKKWKAIWATKGEIGTKSYKQIYNNPKLKADFEKRTTDTLNWLKEEAERKQREIDAKRIKEEEEKLEAWKTDTNIHIHLWHIPIQLRIIQDEIETTKGAKVPLSHGERLFKFFMKCVKEEKVYMSSNNNQSIDSIGVYHLREINKDKNGWFLRVGCHVIYQTAIEDFVKRYNLNW